MLDGSNGPRLNPVDGYDVVPGGWCFAATSTQPLMEEAGVFHAFDQEFACPHTQGDYPYQDRQEDQPDVPNLGRD